MYNIVSSYKGGAFEVICTSDTKEEAMYLTEQYRIALKKEFKVIYYLTDFREQAS